MFEHGKELLEQKIQQAQASERKRKHVLETKITRLQEEVDEAVAESHARTAAHRLSKHKQEKARHEREAVIDKLKRHNVMLNEEVMALSQQLAEQRNRKAFIHSAVASVAASLTPVSSRATSHQPELVALNDTSGQDYVTLSEAANDNRSSIRKELILDSLSEELEDVMNHSGVTQADVVHTPHAKPLTRAKTHALDDSNLSRDLSQVEPPLDQSSSLSRSAARGRPKSPVHTFAKNPRFTQLNKKNSQAYLRKAHDQLNRSHAQAAKAEIKPWLNKDLKPWQKNMLVKPKSKSKFKHKKSHTRG